MVLLRKFLCLRNIHQAHINSNPLKPKEWQRKLWGKRKIYQPLSPFVLLQSPPGRLRSSPSWKPVSVVHRHSRYSTRQRAVHIYSIEMVEESSGGRTRWGGLPSQLDSQQVVTETDISDKKIVLYTQPGYSIPLSLRLRAMEIRKVCKIVAKYLPHTNFYEDLHLSNQQFMQSRCAGLSYMSSWYSKATKVFVGCFFWLAFDWPAGRFCDSDRWSVEIATLYPLTHALGLTPLSTQLEQTKPTIPYTKWI